MGTQYVKFCVIPYNDGVKMDIKESDAPEITGLNVARDGAYDLTLKRSTATIESLNIRVNTQLRVEVVHAKCADPIEYGNASDQLTAGRFFTVQELPAGSVGTRFRVR